MNKFVVFFFGTDGETDNILSWKADLVPESLMEMLLSDSLMVSLVELVSLGFSIKKLADGKITRIVEGRRAAKKMRILPRTRYAKAVNLCKEDGFEGC